MPRFFNPPDIVKPFSSYSQGALVEGPARWLHISGQVGARADGTLEQGFDAQAKRSWSNLLAVLKAGGMEPGDLVMVNVYITRAGDVAASRRIRDEALAGAAPASTMLIVSALALPELLIEVDAVAARSH